MSRKNNIPHYLFGNMIRKHRLRHGLTQQQLSNSIQLHRTYLSGVERGEKNISFDTAIYIIEKLGLSFSDLDNIIINSVSPRS